MTSLDNPARRGHTQFFQQNQYLTGRSPPTRYFASTRVIISLPYSSPCPSWLIILKRREELSESLHGPLTQPTLSSSLKQVDTFSWTRNKFYEVVNSVLLLGKVSVPAVLATRNLAFGRPYLSIGLLESRSARSVIMHGKGESYFRAQTWWKTV